MTGRRILTGGLPCIWMVWATSRGDGCARPTSLASLDRAIAKASNPWPPVRTPLPNDRLHHFIGACLWDSAPLEATSWGQADKLVGGDEAWLISDNTTLPKKGKASVGVAQQYATTLGKNANCQTLLSVTLASGEVPLMPSLRLFLPESWACDPARIDKASAPAPLQEYRTKPEIAIEEIDRIIAARVRFAVCWPMRVTGWRLRSGRR